MRKKVLWGMLIVLLMSSCFAAGISFRFAQAAESKLTDFGLFWEVKELLQDNYVDGVKDTRPLIYGAIRGMLGSLGDDYTRFMEPKAYQEMQVETKGEFGGIGIQIGIDKKSKQITVISPLEDTPAWRVGLKSGDWIMKIDGKSTKDMALEEAVNLIRGKVGTQVKLSILKKGAKDTKDMVITREVIKVHSVTSKMLDKDIGYAKISVFSETTGEDLRNALVKFKSKNAKGVILDLRYNPGGLLDAAIEVSNLFLDKGEPIVQIRGRRGDVQTIYADKGKVVSSLPVAILVNGYSASASEIVSGCLQDHKIATLIGAKFDGDDSTKSGRTFGKGSVQTVHPLQDGSAVAITTAKYFTAKGRDINKIGIEPDIHVNLTKEDLENLSAGDDAKDTQLKKAKQFLHEKIDAHTRLTG